MVREQVLKARKFKRIDLLYRSNRDRTPPDLVFNFTYHPAYSRLKFVLADIHLLLTPDSEHRNAFQNVPIVGFKKGKSLKDILASVVVFALL